MEVPVCLNLKNQEYFYKNQEHIYVAGVERRPTNKEVPPEMIVPSRITVGAGETTMAAKAQPTEVA